MLITSIALLLLRPNAVTLGSLLSSEASGRKLFFCHVDQPFTLESSFEDPKSAPHELHLIGKIQGKCSGYVWDSSRALPFYQPMDDDLQLLKTVRGLGKLVASMPDRSSDLVSSKLGIQGFYDGVEVKSLSPNGVSAAQSVFASYPAELDSSDAKLKLSFSTYVAFTAPDGRYKSYVLQSAGKGGKVDSLAALFKSPVKVRIPKELHERLGRSVLANLPSGHLVTLGDLVSRLAAATTLPLLVDSRLSGDKVFFVSAETTCSALDIADGLAQSMDLYWRRVGSTYFLAVSPGDPRFLCRQKFHEKVCAEARPLIAFVEASGILPSGLNATNLLEGPQAMSDFPQNILGDLATQIDDEDGKQKSDFFKTIGDSGFEKGTVEFYLGGFASISSVAKSSSIGGVSFRLDANQ